MEPIPYNRGLTGQRYLVGVFTHKSMALMVVGMLLCLAVANIWSALIVGAVYTGYQVYLRFGKPPGYESHLAVSWVTPRVLRPGKTSYVRPVKTADE
jgi:hypothetical protein